MKVAIPIWEGRVSPVLDVAQRLSLNTVEAGKIASTVEEACPSQDGVARVKLLVQCQVDVLLCGGISEGLRHRIEESGICVVPHVCGPVEQVLLAFLENRLVEQGLVMPGCGFGPRPGCGRRQQNRQQHRQQRRQRGSFKDRPLPERPSS